MLWLQLRVNTHRDKVEQLENALFASGAVSVTFADNADDPIFEPGLGETPLWQDTSLTALFDADIDTVITVTKVAEASGDTLKNHRWELVEDKDWEREWMKHYHPIQCGENFWICPSWTPPPEPDAVNLLLDPGLAFGTGTHPTTFLCLQWLARQSLGNKTLLDYGCGSGILAIAGLLLGAKSASGVDIDPQALLATKENALRNGTKAVSTYFPQDCPQLHFDVVLANILAGPLTSLAPSLSALTKPGGQLCLSGILQTQAEAVVQAYLPWFEFDPVAQKEEWVCLSATKRSNTQGDGL